MARDILGSFGRDTSQPQAARASSGGVTSAKELPYSPPQGPKGIMSPQSPGLHDDVPGNTSRPLEGHHHSGSPGIGGTNHGCCGSQGKY
jgi:hypothetical protein